jgi:hypothetical protein
MAATIIRSQGRLLLVLPSPPLVTKAAEVVKVAKGYSPHMKKSMICPPHLTKYPAAKNLFDMGIADRKWARDVTFFLPHIKKEIAN